jgi:hypothetical protein
MFIGSGFLPSRCRFVVIEDPADCASGGLLPVFYVVPAAPASKILDKGRRR